MLTQITHPAVDLAPFRPNWLIRLARRLVHSSMSAIKHGQLEVFEGKHVSVFGEAGSDETIAQIRVLNPRFYLRLMLGGTVGAGESYADGDWETPSLTTVVQLTVSNRSVLDGLDTAFIRTFKQTFEKLQYLRDANTRSGSRRNIAAHYDLSNEFFKLWLDERMMYSSAVFDEAEMSLEQASERKLKRLCDLLELQPGDHLLEIGTGWGGFAIYAAQHHNIHVTTTTISVEQHAEAVARVKAANLQGRITVLLEDYRDLQGRFDKVVSVEMVEAVGDKFLDGYFKQVESLLAPGGRFVMQAITIQDQRYEGALKEVDFIKKHIFPGSFIPSVTRLVNAATTTASLRLVRLDDIGLDYAKTLRAWSDNFKGVARELADLGFDARFQRLWQFYFCYCEGGFLARAISDVQIAFDSTHFERS